MIMRIFLLFLKIVFIVYTTYATPQSIIKCSNNTTYWIIPDNNYNYAIRLQGDIDLSNQYDILNIDDKALQYVLLDKVLYTDKNTKNSHTAILSEYVAMESDLLMAKFKGKTHIHSEIKTTSTGKTVILWHFTLPEGKDREVTAQLFADVIIGDKIFGLGAPLFAGQDLDSLKSFLMDAIATIDTVKNMNALCRK